MDTGFNQKKKSKETAAHEEKLPRELIEEILSRVPPKSLVRFRTVSKPWNALFDDKTFINNHQSTFRFILKTKSKIYSVSIDPKIMVRELTLNIPGLEYQIPKDLVECGEFLLCSMDKAKGAAVWNPWLNQTSWIKTDASHPRIQLDGIGYDSNKRVEERFYKTLWYNQDEVDDPNVWRVYDFASDAWKNIHSRSQGRDQGKKGPMSHSPSGVSLNGTLFRIVFYENVDDPLYYLMKFDFLREGFFRFCDLPCGRNHLRDALVLRVFKGDGFSLLKQCYETKKIEVWVTKDKVNVTNGDDVVWMKFMTVSVPEVPGLVQNKTYTDPSYFIDDKRLVVCFCDENRKAWIYVLGENKLISKVQIDSALCHRPLQHCTYFPSLVPVPRGQREDAELQV
ncbi:hypothetical protein EUTSA_v10022412mg [Eutrema salsugineum]|uniref:F-box domain-containing protein n=1 Tax=Eutrema salsugineum TaxID=72664 RepID=V4M790_EUTSA|nr:F-box protein At2g14710 [Eutrema salsugineum]ESQ48213.1 hypothetical protein EUTSA_v10022412mg [Eutrema salsugineum]